MAAGQPISVMPGRSAAGGYVYIVQFASGAIKVGRTQNPASRLKSHAATARAHGIAVAAQWVSQPIATARQNERLLIDFCKVRFTAVNGGEYFSGAEIGEVIAFAETLDGSEAGKLRMMQVAVLDPKNGRPLVGPKVELRLSEDDLARVEERAKKEGVSRAEMLRRLVVASL